MDDIVPIENIPCEKRVACYSSSLDCANKGDLLEVVSVEDDMARIQAIRFGIAPGAIIECLTKIPFGPIVISIGRQEIAIGRELSRRIKVKFIRAKT